MPNRSKYLTKEEFDRFRENDFYHLRLLIEEVRRQISFIKGQLWLTVPLLLALVGLMTSLLLKGK